MLLLKRGLDHTPFLTLVLFNGHDHNVTLVNRMVTGAYNVPGHNVTLVNRMVTGAYYVPGYNVTLANKMVTGDMTEVHNMMLGNKMVTGAYYVPGYNVTLVNKMVANYTWASRNTTIYWTSETGTVNETTV